MKNVVAFLVVHQDKPVSFQATGFKVKDNCLWVKSHDRKFNLGSLDEVERRGNYLIANDTNSMLEFVTLYRDIRLSSYSTDAASAKAEDVLAQCHLRW